MAYYISSAKPSDNAYVTNPNEGAQVLCNTN